jgi:subtilisin family serine protease
MKRVIFITFLILLATSFTTMAGEMTDVGGPNPDVPSFIGYATDRIVVKFDPSTLRGLDKASFVQGRTGIPALDHLGAHHGVISLRPQFPGARKKTYKGKEVDLAGWHKVKFSRGVDVLAVVEEYKAIPGVVDAQPVGIQRVSQTPNDPRYLQGYQWHLPQIMAEEAWDIATGNSNSPIIVAVLDTGVRYFHRDLGGSNASLSDPTAVAGNMWINLAEKNGIEGVDDDGVTDSGFGYVDDWIAWDFVDDPCANPIARCYPCCCFEGVDDWGNPIREDCEVPDNDPRDFHGHGTHCAGNVSAINNNEFATASPAGGWGSWSVPPFGNGVKVMALRVGWDAIYVIFEAGMVSLDYVAEAFYYAADHEAKIVSCSWTADTNSGGLGEAIDYFLASGGLIFKAAGNDSTETTGDYMCARDDVICVAATDQNDCRAGFSTYGTWVDVSAPGVQIGSLYHWKGDETNDYVATFDGTSMATPLAASVAALIWSRDTNQSANDVKNILFASADPIDTLLCNSSFAGKLGAGRINAYQAVLSVGPPPPPACTDADNDGFFVETGCETATDCNDNDDGIYPGATEVCGDGIDQDCSGSDSLCPNDVDDDGDGYTENQGDCNDSDPAIHPGATEICDDSTDNDCDELIDSSDPDCSTPPSCTDEDSDGYYKEGGVCGAVDCNDQQFYIHPGAYDYCKNGIDEDCDGFDRTKGKGCKDGGGNGGVKEICDNGIDDDGDGKTDCADKKDCRKDPACP